CARNARLFMGSPSQSGLRAAADGRGVKFAHSFGRTLRVSRVIGITGNQQGVGARFEGLSSMPAARLESAHRTRCRASAGDRRPETGGDAMGKKTIAELLVETLVSRRVSRIYGVAGDSLNGITDAIRRQDQLRWIPVRHEETAAFAAGAEAHLTGQ